MRIFQGKCEKNVFFLKNDLTNDENAVILCNIQGGVVAKRLGSGLQNRVDRFDSDPRLHFFFAFFQESVSNPCKKHSVAPANSDLPRNRVFFLP